MAIYTSDQVLKLAKTHLAGLRWQTVSDHEVPQSYIQSLSSFLREHPDDTNFRLVLQQNKGYGVIRCGEDSCRSGATIRLTKNNSVSDGGLKDGVGSLSRYKTHVQQESHANSRNLRVQQEDTPSGILNTTPSNLIKRESSAPMMALSLQKTSSLSARKSLLNKTPTPRAASSASTDSKTLTPLEIARRRASARMSETARVKPEPTGAVVPSKRPASDMNSVNRDPTPQSSSLVRQTDSSTSSRLERENREIASAPTTAIDSSDIREKIQNVQHLISGRQQLLDGLLRKSRKSKGDYTRIKKYQDELEKYQAQKDALQSSLPALPLPVSPARRPLAPSASQGFIKPEPMETDIPPRPNRPDPAPRPPMVKAEPIVKPDPDFVDPISLPMCPPSSSPPSSPTLRKSEVDTDDDDDLPMPGMWNPDEAAAAVSGRYATAIPSVAPTHDPYDENGDFHGRGRDTFRGPQAKADDIEKFLVEAGNAEQFDGSATVEEALTKLELPTIYTPLTGMTVALMPHQAIGVAWMVEKERGKLKGGCLADEMGLGKTVQMMALMTKNQSNDPHCKTNLILAPLALLDQWKMEIELKTNDLFKCLVYHGNNKPRKKSELLAYDVIITTTNTMALEWPDPEGDQKRKVKLAKKQKQKKDDFIVSDTDEDDEGPVTKKQKKEHGLLFQVDFYRVILDEAQNIRTRRTRVSRAITELKAKYRWCLTGTPIINSLIDAYAYLRFLQVRPWYDWTEFNQQIGRPEKKRPDLAVMRLQKIFDIFLLRRKKDTMLDGKRLIELPDRNVHLNKLEFSEEEREIYSMVERKSQAIFNRFLRAGTVLKNYTQVLVLLLRLRQICTHPCLIQEGGGAFVMPDDVENESRPDVRRELARARDLVSAAFVTKLKEKFKHEAMMRIKAEKESADATIETEECPICFDAFTDPMVTPCAHIFCQNCLNDVLNGPHVEAADNPHKYAHDERPCPVCRLPIHANKLFTRFAFEPTDDDLFPPEKPAAADSDVEMAEVAQVVKLKKRKAKKDKGKRKAVVIEEIEIEDSDPGVIDLDNFETDPEDEPVARRRSSRAKKIPVYVISDSEDEDEATYEDDDNDSMDDFIVDDDEDEDSRPQKKNLGKRKAQIVLDSDDEMEDDTPEEKEVIFGRKKKQPKTPEEIKLMPRFLPSTKMKWMMEEIERLQREKPDEKILIISQWTGCLSLVSDYLSEYNVRHVKYQGDMSRPKRDQAVRVFMSKDNAPIMLMSMKCGGVGLNLTRGNNVISLDLGWSQAVENQAFDRVHRLGQAKPVQIQRLVIENTVEDRILALQERKQNLADGSLGEGKGKKIGRLSVKELANLFGMDANGRVIPT